MYHYHQMNSIIIHLGPKCPHQSDDNQSDSSQRQNQSLIMRNPAYKNQLFINHPHKISPDYQASVILNRQFHFL